MKPKYLNITVRAVAAFLFWLAIAHLYGDANPRRFLEALIVYAVCEALLWRKDYGSN